MNVEIDNWWKTVNMTNLQDDSELLVHGFLHVWLTVAVTGKATGYLSSFM